MSERRANVYENKGLAFSRLARSGNVIENTGSYALKAQMLLKRKVVGMWQVVGSEEQDSGVRIQEPGAEYRGQIAEHSERGQCRIVNWTVSCLLTSRHRDNAISRR